MMFASLLLRCGRRVASRAALTVAPNGRSVLLKTTQTTAVPVVVHQQAQQQQPQRDWASDAKSAGPSTPSSQPAAANMAETKEELRKRLTPLQYQVTQEAGTERPYTGKYDKFYETGMYQCIVCHQDLFSSETKFDSGCGWPAFNDVLDKGKITLHRDASIAGCNLLLLIKHPERIRTEVRCSQCGAHMGHVFEDGPPPTRKRYCINSASIEFLSADQLNAKPSE